MDTLRSHRFLVAIDEGEATTRALAYLGALLGNGPKFEVVLFHLLSPLPTGLLEHGGSSDRAEEERIEAAQGAEQTAWLAKTREAAEPFLDHARAALVAHGVPEASIQVQCAETIPEDRAADLLLQEARSRSCGTIVVGRSSFPWLQERFHRHIGTELAKEAEGFTILIVE